MGQHGSRGGAIILFIGGHDRRQFQELMISPQAQASTGCFMRESGILDVL